MGKRMSGHEACARYNSMPMVLWYSKVLCCLVSTGSCRFGSIGVDMGLQLMSPKVVRMLSILLHCQM
jgi:hypothetical protein